MAPHPKPGGEISMDSLSPSQNREFDDSASSVSGAAPPTHFIHNHDPNNPHFYEGIEPGNGGDSSNHHHQSHPHAGNGNGNGGWGQYDTFVDEKKAHRHAPLNPPGKLSTEREGERKI